MFTQADLIFIIVLLLTAGVNIFFAWKNSKKKNDTPEQTKESILHTLKEEVLKLFLYAEKNDWVGEGPDKLQWCIEQTYGLIPEPFRDTLENIIGPDTLDKWVEDLYNKFKDGLQKQLDEEHNAQVQTVA